MSFRALITRMTQAACAADGAGVASCFTPDGIYDDVFYGAFQGQDIAGMITDYFHRDARDFRWDVHEAISDGETGMARYVFSFESKLSGCEGKRAIFEGAAICTLRDGLIHHYGEVADTMTGQRMMGFSDAKMIRFVDRQTEALKARSETANHL
ncbi:MAG: nuclear transport factor 2 family protein [Pseudomonadota bacterium]